MFVTPVVSKISLWNRKVGGDFRIWYSHRSVGSEISGLCRFIYCKYTYVAPTITNSRVYHIDTCPFHSTVCLTTGPQLLPKRVVHRMRSSSSSFNLQYPPVSLRSSSSCLRLLSRLPVTCFTFCLSNVFPTQDVTLFLLHVGYSCLIWLYVMFLLFSHDRSDWSPIILRCQSGSGNLKHVAQRFVSNSCAGIQLWYQTRASWWSHKVGYLCSEKAKLVRWLWFLCLCLWALVSTAGRLTHDVPFTNVVRFCKVLQILLDLGLYCNFFWRGAPVKIAPSVLTLITTLHIIL